MCGGSAGGSILRCDLPLNVSSHFVDRGRYDWESPSHLKTIGRSMVSACLAQRSFYCCHLGVGIHSASPAARPSRCCWWNMITPVFFMFVDPRIRLRPRQ